MNAPSAPLFGDLPVWNALLAWFGAPRPLGSSQILLGLSSEPAPAGSPAFALQTSHGPMAARLVHFPLAAVAGVQLTLEQLDQLPPPLGQIIRDELSAMLTAMLPAGLRACLIGIEQGDAPLDPDVETLGLLVQSPGWPEAARLELRAARSTICGLARAMSLSGPFEQLPNALAEVIPVRLQQRLRGPRVTLSRVRALEPGDLLLIAAGTARLVAPHLRITLASSEQGWTVSEIDPTPEGSAGLVAEAPIAASLEDLPVTVSFALDHRTMTLAELQQLRPGTLMALSSAAPGIEVDVLANGARIGSGHVIEIDGQPAVRLTTLFGQTRD